MDDRSRKRETFANCASESSRFARRLFASVCILIALTGCHALGVPSYRYDDPMVTDMVVPGAYGHLATENLLLTEPGNFHCCSAAGLASPGAVEEERVALLPPMIHFNKLCKLLGIRHLPPAPPHPRFHPVPTRPVFQPRSHAIQAASGATMTPEPVAAPAPTDVPRRSADKQARRLPDASSYEPYPVTLQHDDALLRR